MDALHSLFLSFEGKKIQESPCESQKNSHADSCCQSSFKINLQLANTTASNYNLLSWRKIPCLFAKVFAKTNDSLDVKIKTQLDVYSIQLYYSSNGSLHLPVVENK